MRKTLISALASLALFLSACESTSVVEPTQTQNLTSFKYSGGLNTKFDSGSTEFQDKARITPLDLNRYRLDIQISVRSASINENEQGNISFRYQFESENGNLPAGNYSIETQEPSNSLAHGDYQLTKGPNSFARYSFNGSRLSLRIESNESGRLAGTFMLHLKQTSGKRMLDGQLETVQLALPIVASGYFDLEVERMN